MVIANFEKGYTTASASGLWNWDYGQVLRIQGLDLPTAVEIHFSLQDKVGDSVTRIGTTKDGITDVIIPDSILEKIAAQRTYDAFAFIYLTDETSGQTKYKISMEVRTRPKPEAFDKPEDAELFREAIRAVNEAADRAEDAVSETNIGKIVAEWLEENPVGDVDPEELAKAVEEYLTAHPLEETDPTVPSWAKKPEPPIYTAEQVGADKAGTAVAKVGEHNVATDSHEDIRLLLQGLSDRVNTILDSDDTTLDQMSEIVTYIKSNKSLIDAISTGKVSVGDIIDNLTTNVANKPLSAAQGVKLKQMIEAIVVPDKLPNPKKLSINIGDTVLEYDGSGAVTITIPDADVTERIEKTSADTVVELQPNKLYIFPEMETITYTFGQGKTNVAKEYHFIFQSGATPTEVVHPSGVNVGSLTVEANKIYEISVMENMLTSQSWAVV